MLIDVVVPAAGESISEVDIAEWRKSEGAAVRRDDALVIAESDKATLEIPAPESGTLTKILKQTGEKAAVGEVIGRIERDEVEDHDAGPEKNHQPERASHAPMAEPPGAGETSPHSIDQTEPRKEAEQITGISAPEPPAKTDSGRQPPDSDGRESRADNQQEPSAPAGASPETSERREVPALAPPPRPGSTDQPSQTPERMNDSAVAPQPGGQIDRKETTVPMTVLRRRIAERLVQAQQTAALLTTFNEIDMSKVTETRGQYRELFVQKHGVKLGIMSFFVKAAVAALKVSPEINAEIRGDRIVYRSYYDIGIAVGGGKGLVVPVLRDAERMSFAEIETAIADFARRARDARLNPEDLEGGTFTITNGGIYGSLLSTPIVNPPQTAILGMHAVQERPVARGGAVVIRPMMYVALTYDHRLVDGREAVSFLRQVKEFVEEPARILFEI